MDYLSTLPVQPKKSTGHSTGDEAVKRIVVTLHTTGNQELDKRRIRRVYDTFVSHPGEDRFAFVIMESDGGRVELDFVNDTTHYCDDLQRQLFKFVTPDVIDVEAFV